MIGRALSAALVIAATAMLLSMAIVPEAAIAEDGPATQAEYASRVSRAHAEVEAASKDLLDSREGSDLAATINTLVPGSEHVEMRDGTVVATDNSTLRSLVSKLDTAEDEGERGKIADQMLAYLTSLESSVGKPGEVVPSDPELLEELLAQRPPDSSAFEEYLADLLRRLGEWFESLFSGFEGSSTATTVLVWIFRVLIAGLVVLLGYVVFRVLQRMRRSVVERDTRIADEAAVPIVAAAEGLPDDALAHADSLAKEGAYREAVRALYGGAARALVEAGVVRQSRTLTTAELIRVVDGALPAVRPSLTKLSWAFEVSWYGHRDPGSEGYAEARDEHTIITEAAARFAGGGDAA